MKTATPRIEESKHRLEHAAFVSSRRASSLHRAPGEQKSVSSAEAGYRFWPRHTALVITDGLSLLLSAAVATLAANYVFASFPELIAYRLVGASVFLAVLAYAVAGLYNAGLSSPAEEVRTQGLMTTAVFGSVAMGAVLLLLSRAQPLLVCLGAAWGLALVAVPLGRAFLRRLCAHRSWWSCPVVVLGAGAGGCRLVRTLIHQPELGLRPVALLDDDTDRHGETVEGVPVVGLLAQATYFSQEGVPYALAALSSIEKQFARRLEYCTSGFRSVLVVPNGFLGLPSRWVRAREVGGVVGLEMRQRLRSRWRRILKRAFDVSVALAALVALLPFGAVAAVLIKIDSRGSVFYRQSRLGQGGRTFDVFKFRSMYVGADERLQDVLESDPAARAEYERYQKLADDPRVTPVGRILRKTSLDEVPQLLNVLRGEMSLVGPRAYLPDERSEMKDLDHVILRALPGITGLWQVSGRSDLSFAARVDLDASYVRNWSLSFDLYLLARTLPVVLLGTGAK